ncbi:MAG: SGNH/GDSL hydrolase family protein [Candidatus Nanopelagicales bacterium]
MGDSFTEGLGDPGVDGRDRGWADRVGRAGWPLTIPASRTPTWRCAVGRFRRSSPSRSRLLTALHPDLVSFAGGINDALRRDWDLVSMAQNLQAGMADLAATGAQLVIVTYRQPSRRSRLMAVVEGRLREYREVTYDVAAAHGATVVELWDATVFDDPRFSSDHRLHLNPLGHKQVSMAVLDALGMPVPAWQQPLPTIAAQAPWARVSDDVTWFGRHFAPWIVRKARGRRSGDGITAKRPQCLPVSEAS